jgi:hypothetical protein
MRRLAQRGRFQAGWSVIPNGADIGVVWGDGLKSRYVPTGRPWISGFSVSRTALEVGPTTRLDPLDGEAMIG